MNQSLILLVLISFVIGSCQSDDEAAISSHTNTIIVASPPAAGSDPFELVSVSQDGTIVTAVVRYSGGCEDHRFSVHWNGSATKSLPPQMVVNVYHDDQSDTCEAYLTDTVRFDAQELLGDGWNLEQTAVLIIHNVSDGETIRTTVQKQ